MNGACYVLDGSVKQITNKMVLYVPKGIAIEKLNLTKHNEKTSMIINS